MKRKFLFLSLIIILMLCGCKDADTEKTTKSAYDESTDAVSVPKESLAESSCSSEPSDTSVFDETNAPDEEFVLELKVEIYKENTRELLTCFELTDQSICTKIFDAFDKCFAEVVETYPHDPAPDMHVKTDYRVAVYLNTYYDVSKENLAYYVDISYPHGYTNDIYRLMHHGESPFGDYVARCGKEFIDLVDQYVKQYIPAN